MKKQKFSMTIDTPCSQDWASMTPNSLGKYCAHCSKNVIDFTNLSDQEIIRIIQQSSGKLCGRLTAEQQRKVFVEHEEQSYFNMGYRLLMGFLLLSFTSRSQVVHASKQPIEIMVKEKQGNGDALRSYEQEKTVPSLLYFEGKVVDDSLGMPMAFVSISIRHQGILIITCITDEEGVFRFNIPDSLLTELFVFQLSTSGYHKKEVAINMKDWTYPQLFTLKYNPSYEPIHMVGAVSIVQKKKWWQFRRNFRRNRLY